VIRPVSRIRDRIYPLRRAGVRFGTCGPVLCEVEAGELRLTRKDSHRHQLEHFRQQLRLWPIDQAVARHFGEVYWELKRAGRTLSQVDLMLAAMARQMNVTLLTADRDFEALPDLRIENWLT
jgi:tRNA(fMet)-specific endonuclease VapC